MRLASNVKSNAFALGGILTVWATIAFAQVPADADELEDPAELVEPSDTKDQPSQMIVPRAPLQAQRNTLCDTSYSRITNCGEQEDEEEEQLPER